MAAAAISTAHELGILDVLHEAGNCSLEEFGTAGRAVAPPVLRSLLNTLAWADVVELTSGTDGARSAGRGRLFDQAYATRGYFYWLVRGCGQLFTIAPDLSWDGGGPGYRRDMRAVAVGSRLIGDVEVEPLFDRILDGLDVSCVADLGCGSGQRLVRIMLRDPGVRGIGVDVASASVELARSTVADVGLSDRITVLQGNVHELTPSAEFAEVDVVTCVFMGHDFWPYEQCVATLRRLREAFSGAKTLLLCDVTRNDDVPG
nr:class I SAM-dependent methyltransferase [Micromonospora sp. DSM 115978]